MRTHRILWLIALLFLVIGCLTIHDYNITWDEPENFMIGRIYFNAYLHPLSDILAHPTTLPIPPPLPFRTETHYERYPPFADTLASITSFALGERAKLLDPIAAHHLTAVIFGSLAILTTGLITVELTESPIAAIVAALALATYPLFIGLSHTDIKDVPGAAMFTLTIYTILRAIKKKSYITTLIAGMTWGMALATKVSNTFAPVVIAVTLLLTMRVWHRRLLHQSINHVVLFSLAGGTSLLAAWPWLITDTIPHLLLIYQYINEVGRGLPVLFAGRVYHAGIDTPWYYAPVSIAVVTPIPMLLAAILGIGVSIHRQKNEQGKPLLLLPVVWVCIILTRYLFPSITVYNGIRQFLEVIPAIAILTGIGVGWIIRKFGTMTRFSPILTALTLAVLFIPTARNDVVLHPYEMLYFNRMSGGIQKASTTYEFDYWGFSAGELVKRVNALPEVQGKTVNINWLDFPSWYFPDNRLTFVPSDASPDYVIVPHSENFFVGAKTYWDTHGRRLYTITRVGAEVGYLYEAVKP